MKLLNKIMVASIGFAMSIGGCIVGASSSFKHANAVGTTYTKVTSNQADWSGNYLIVCESASVAFNGVDASSNAKTVTIADGKIVGEYTSYEITIAPMSGGYSLKNSANQYLYNTSGGNSTKFSNSAQLNTISFSNGNIDIVCNDTHFRKNKDSSLFRYYKSSSYSDQKTVQLYKAGVAAELTGISVKSAPSKTKYVVGETFDPKGLILEATYDDASTKEVTNGFTFTPNGALSLSDTSVTITYQGKTCTQAIGVVELTNVTMTGTPTTKTYFEGQIFDPTGLTVTATYSDSTSADVIAYVEWGTLVKNVTTLKGTYAGFELTVTGLVVKAAPGYSKVSSATELKTDDKLLFVYNSSAAASTFETRYFKSEPVTVTNGFITPSDNITIFTLKGSEGSWSFLTSLGYVKATGTDNQNMNFEENITTNSQWTIDIDNNGNAVIKNVKFTSMAIRYNSNNPRFTVYPNASLQPIQLYKLAGSVDDAITSVALDKTGNQDIIINGNVKLTATIQGGEDANKNINWTSTNNSVVALSSAATVSGTEITVLGLAEGTATVTATAAGDETKFASININVINPNNVQKVELDKHKIGFTLRPTCEPIKLTATVTPSLAVQSVNWTTSDADIATVDDSGNVAAGTKAGVATITVKSTVKPEMYDTCEVIVFTKKGQEATPVQVADMINAMDKEFYPYDTFAAAPYEIHFEGIVTEVDHVGATTVSLTIEDTNDANKVLRLDDCAFGSIDVTEIVVGTKVIASCVESKLSITTSYYKIKDSNLVSIDNTGLAIQNVALSGATTLKVGTSTSLIVTYSPRYTNQRELTWLTSDPTKATVDNGVVTGVGEGEVIITARSVANSAIEGTWTLTILPSEQIEGTYVLHSNATAYAEISTPTDFADGIDGFDTSVFECDYSTRISVYAGSTDADDIFVGANNHIQIALKDSASGYVISEVIVGATKTTGNEATLSINKACEYTLTKTDRDYYIPVFSRTLKLEMLSDNAYINYISIKVVEIDDDTIVNEAGQAFLDVTSGACSILNVTSENWNNAIKAFTLADGYYSTDLLTQLKTMEANQSGSIMQQALARYDYIYAKYATGLTLSNPLNRTITPMSSFTLLERQSDSMLLIVVISSISVISLAGLFLILRKKKHN